MDNQGLIYLSVANFLALAAVIFHAGKFVAKQETLDIRVTELEKHKTEVVMAGFKIQLETMTEKIDVMSANFTHFVDYLVSGDKKILKHFDLIGKAGIRRLDGD